MKFKFIIISIMLALALCITPVAAVSADDFKVDIDESGWFCTYTYSNKNNQSEEYIDITADNTDWLSSLVTFKPANIPDAPVMMVDTSYSLRPHTIYLPYSVDYWEIKYYSTFGYILYEPNDKYLKNHGVVNLKKFFGEYIKDGLVLKLSMFQCIVPRNYFLLYFLDARMLEYHIPDVD